jgi:hypothetical protein
MMTISFLIWIYLVLREKLHPVVTGMLMLLFLTLPDPYGYTYIILFDYSNMIFFFAGFYYLVRYAEDYQYKNFLFSAFMFGLATYIRTETLILLGIALPLLAYIFWKAKMSIPKMIISTGIFFGISFVLYYIWMGIFVKYYMPVQFDVNEQVKLSFTNLSLYFKRMGEINDMLIFGGLNIIVYGYYLYIFMTILVIDIVLFRKSFNLEAAIALYGIALVYVGIPLLGYLIPWFDVTNTSKRSMYKLLPLILLYLRNSGLVTKISGLLTSFESDSDATPEPRRPASRPTTVQPQSAVGKKKK